MPLFLSCAERLIAAADCFGRRARILGRFGGYHFAAGRHGAGYAFGGRLLAMGLAAILCFGLAAMASLTVSDWVQNRYASSELSRAAGVLSFMIIFGALGLALVRFL